MKTAGIIAEYNPFHNGHLYHIEETRRITGADSVIVVMSGSFTQRGTPAVTDKYARARMALHNGADLVLELPTLFATGSAGDFAAGAVSLLDKLQVVDHLSFGSEAGILKNLTEAAALLAEEPPVFCDMLKQELKSGSSFAKARFTALNACLTAPLPEGPNNLLGLEYCIALKKRNSRIKPVTIQRKGSGYHNTDLTDTFSSALAIRNSLQSDAAVQKSAEMLSRNVPPAVLGLWEEILSAGRMLYPSDFTKELRYRILSEANGDFTGYADVSRELSDKIKNQALSFFDWDDLCIRLKSKELTYSRISRALCHILLGITADQLQEARQADYAPYARILGFRKSAQPLLSEIKKSSEIPLLSKLADAQKVLSPQALSILQKDIAAAHLYESALSCKCRQPLRNEYRQPIIVL